MHNLIHFYSIMQQKIAIVDIIDISASIFQ
jgi:hypothetical protein